ncbi:hypothetical protein F4782DRAFT_522714 [Xylaria castorea]|nr:hypothetical protein F4782DRAFT_522714 [Xylaria castorea]
MSGSARARGGPARPSFTQSTVGRSRVSKSGSATRLAIREKEVVVIESDEDDVSDYGDYARDSADGLPTPQHTSSAVSDHAVPETPTRKNGGRAPGRIAALVRSLDTTLHTPPTRAPSSILDGPYSSKKTNGLVLRRDEPSMKDADTSGRYLLHTPSTFASSGSPHGTQSSKSQSSRRIGGAICKKEDTDTETSRRKLNNTLASATITNGKATLPRPSSALPPAFPPAVKPRVYSASRPGGKRNIDIGSKKLEAFGFVSAASLLPGTTTWNAATIPPVASRQNAAAVTPLPRIEPKPVSKPILKPIKQEEVRILGAGRKSLLRATQDTAAAATSPSISKTMYKPIKQEPSQVRVSAPRLLPQTPEKPIRAKQARTLSYSIGSYRDPYAISSDSEDDHSNRNGNPYSCPPLRSFAEIADTHETASDVEAVLNQFPAWLDSPSPTELRSSYLGTSRPTTSSRPGKRLWGDGIGNRGRMGGDCRRVRFCEGDGFSTSPVPAKRTTAPSRLTYFEDRVTSSIKRNASPIREITSPGRLTSSIDQAGSPIRRVTSFKRVDSLQTTSLNSCGPSPSPAELRTPRVEITIADSESESSDGSNEDMNPNSNSNSNPDHDKYQNHDNSIQQQRNIPRVEGLKKERKKRRRRNDKEHNVITCRHRNRNRKTWREGRRVKRR